MSTPYVPPAGIDGVLEKTPHAYVAGPTAWDTKQLRCQRCGREDFWWVHRACTICGRYDLDEPLAAESHICSLCKPKVAEARRTGLSVDALRDRETAGAKKEFHQKYRKRGARGNIPAWEWYGVVVFAAGLIFLGFASHNDNMIPVTIILAVAAVVAVGKQGHS